MNRWLILFFLAATLLPRIFLPHSLSADETEQNLQINTPVQAAEYAAKLANERTMKAFGKTPFTPQSYSPRRTDARWHWGEIVPPGICGYSAEVEFNTDGSDPQVRAVLHTDQMSIRDMDQYRFPTIIEDPVVPLSSPEETVDDNQ